MLDDKYDATMEDATPQLSEIIIDPASSLEFQPAQALPNAHGSTLGTRNFRIMMERLANFITAHENKRGGHGEPCGPWMKMLNKIPPTIAELHLELSEGVVKNHVSSVLSKLGVRDRTRAVLKGIEMGYI